VTLDEIRTTLFAAAKLRVPKFDARDSTGQRIDKMETYLLTVASTCGDLEEARLFCHQALHDLDGKWQEQEYDIPVGQKGAMSGPAIAAAKAAKNPLLAAQIREMKWLIARLTEQISRLSRMGDDQIVSRVYTFMAGT
jgi:hypothetical protein